MYEVQSIENQQRNRQMGRTSDMPVQRMQSMPQQQQMANMMARDMAMAQMGGMQQQPSLKYRVPASEQPVTQDQPQIRPYRTDQLQQDVVRTNQPDYQGVRIEPAVSELKMMPALKQDFQPASDRVGVPSMNQLMSGIYGGGFNPYMGGGMGRGMGFGGMGRGMGFGGFNPYMGGGGMGFGGFNPYMGGRGMNRGMGFGGFNPYMAQPQPAPMPMQLPDFARQMYGIGQQTNPYGSMEQIMPLGFKAL